MCKKYQPVSSPCYVRTRNESESVSRSVVSDSLQPMNYRPLGSSVHGILQARMLEWVAIHFSRGSSRPKDRTFCDFQWDSAASVHSIKHTFPSRQGSRGSLYLERIPHRPSQDSLFLCPNVPSSKRASLDKLSQNSTLTPQLLLFPLLAPSESHFQHSYSFHALVCERLAV